MTTNESPLHVERALTDYARPFCDKCSSKVGKKVSREGMTAARHTGVLTLPDGIPSYIFLMTIIDMEIGGREARQEYLV